MYEHLYTLLQTSDPLWFESNVETDYHLTFQYVYTKALYVNMQVFATVFQLHLYIFFQFYYRYTK